MIMIDTTPNCFINGSILHEVCCVTYTLQERVPREASRSDMMLNNPSVPRPDPQISLVFESKVSLKIYYTDMFITYQKFRSFQPP